MPMMATSPTLMNYKVVVYLFLLFVHHSNSKVLEYSNVNIGYIKQIPVEEQHTYVFNVDAANTSGSKQSYSAFVFQVHAEKASVTLMNISKGCSPNSRECFSVGLHIGMVQLLPLTPKTTYNFSVDYWCSNCSSDSQQLLVAVVGIPVNDPIPGGCSLTSDLEIDPSLSVLTNETTSSASITFQNSDDGYDPNVTNTEPVCTDRHSVVTTLKYLIYQKCYKNPDPNDVFYAIRSLISSSALRHDILNLGFQSFKGNSKKRLNYVLRSDQVVVFNVLAFDTSGRSAAYVPAIARECVPGDTSCSHKVDVPTMVCGPILGLIGIFLCFLGHRFFHVEVALMSLLVSCFIVFLVFSVATDLNGTDLILVTIGLGLVLTTLIFVLHFFTNWTMLYLLVFALCSTFLITAAILYTPIGNISLLRLWYIYVLALFCGTLVFVLPFVCFPAVLNIIATSVIGSYAIVFAIGTFVGSYLNDVILNVVYSAAVPGYLASNGHCGLDVLDTTLSSAWALLLIAGILCQGVVDVVRRAAFKRKEKKRRERCESSFRQFAERKYSPFPIVSLYKHLLMTFRRGTNGPIRVLSATREDVNERRPLMSPNFTPRYGSQLQ